MPNIDGSLEKSLSLLNHAASCGNLKKLKLAVTVLRLNVNSTSGRSLQTPLHKTAKYGHLKCAEYLIENGAKLEIVDSEGRTPLAIAALHGEMDIIALLCTKGANVNAQCKKKKTILMYAMQSLPITDIFKET
eukprot:Sdes_comp20496_c0_seq1m14941